MSLADGIVLLMVACAAVAVLRFMRNQKKAGKTACGCCGGAKAKEGA